MTVDLESTTTRAATQPGHRSRRSSAGSSALAVLVPGALLSTVLTAWNYSSKPLWRDEWYTLSTAGRPFADMLEIIKGPDVGLAGFYGVMHLWLLADDSVRWLRLLSALATVALTVVTARLAHHLAGPAAGIIAGLLVAVLPPVVSHAQEARAYPLVLLTTAVTATLLLHYRDHPSGHRGWWLAGAAVLPGCLHPIVGLPAVAALFLGALIAPGSARRTRLVLISSPAAVGGLLLLAAGFRQQVGGPSQERISLAEIARLPGSLTTGPWLMVPVWALALLGLVLLARRATGGRAWVVLLCWLIIPFVVVGGLGLAGSFFQPRYVSDVAPLVAVLVAVGVVGPLSAARPRRRITATVAAAAATLVIVVPAVVSAVELRERAYYSDDPRAAALAVVAGAEPGDAVVYISTTARGMTTYYLPPSTPVEDALMVQTPLQGRNIAGREVPADERRQVLSGYKRVWVVGKAREGRWSDEAKVADATVGRTRVSGDRYGDMAVELWAVEQAAVTG